MIPGTPHSSSTVGQAASASVKSSGVPSNPRLSRRQKPRRGPETVQGRETPCPDPQRPPAAVLARIWGTLPTYRRLQTTCPDGSGQVRTGPTPRRRCGQQPSATGKGALTCGFTDQSGRRKSRRFQEHATQHEQLQPHAQRGGAHLHRRGCCSDLPGGRADDPPPDLPRSSSLPQDRPLRPLHGRRRADLPRQRRRLRRSLRQRRRDGGTAMCVGGLPVAEHRGTPAHPVGDALHRASSDTSGRSAVRR